MSTHFSDVVDLCSGLVRTENWDGFMLTLSRLKISGNRKRDGRIDLNLSWTLKPPLRSDSVKSIDSLKIPGDGFQSSVLSE